jgi:predicted DNA-binding ribbon-helix-helix protein
MCDIYTSADPIHYEQRTRSMRIHGVVTSIRLENLCWDILARIAAKDQMTTNQLIGKLYEEIVERRGGVDNLSSFLRVSCMRYLSYVAEQQEKDHLMLKQPAVADSDEASTVVEVSDEALTAPLRPAARLHRLDGKRARQA